MKKTFLILLVSSFSICTWADFSPGAVSTATGGSGRGTTEPVDSVLLNPAIVSILPSKFFSANYTSEQWGITISDNGKDALFPAALSFVRSDIDGFKTQQVGVAISYAFFGKMLALGTNLEMLEYDRTTNYLDQKYRQTAADVGLVFSPSPSFGIGLVANKVAASTSDLNPTLQKQKTFGVGTQYTYRNFVRFRFDTESGPENKTERLVYMGGIETYMNDWIVFRLGYQNNNVISKNYQSAGLGFTGPQFGLHYAYISNVANNQDDKHSIDLGIPF